MLELGTRIVMSIRGALDRHTKASLGRPANEPSLFDYGYAVGVADGLRQAEQVILAAISNEEEDDEHGSSRRVALPGRR